MPTISTYSGAIPYQAGFKSGALDQANIESAKTAQAYREKAQRDIQTQQLENERAMQEQKLAQYQEEQAKAEIKRLQDQDNKLKEFEQQQQRINLLKTKGTKSTDEKEDKLKQSLFLKYYNADLTENKGDPEYVPDEDIIYKKVNETINALNASKKGKEIQTNVTQQKQAIRNRMVDESSISKAPQNREYQAFLDENKKKSVKPIEPLKDTLNNNLSPVSTSEFALRKGMDFSKKTESPITFDDVYQGFKQAGKNLLNVPSKIKESFSIGKKNADELKIMSEIKTTQDLEKYEQNKNIYEQLKKENPVKGQYFLENWLYDAVKSLPIQTERIKNTYKDIVKFREEHPILANLPVVGIISPVYSFVKNTLGIGKGDTKQSIIESWKDRKVPITDEMLDTADYVGDIASIPYAILDFAEIGALGGGKLAGILTKPLKDGIKKYIAKKLINASTIATKESLLEGAQKLVTDLSSEAIDLITDNIKDETKKQKFSRVANNFKDEVINSWGAMFVTGGLAEGTKAIADTMTKKVIENNPDLVNKEQSTQIAQEPIQPITEQPIEQPTVKNIPESKTKLTEEELNLVDDPAIKDLTLDTLNKKQLLTLSGANVLVNENPKISKIFNNKENISKTEFQKATGFLDSFNQKERQIFKQNIDKIFEARKIKENRIVEEKQKNIPITTKQETKKAISSKGYTPGTQTYQYTTDISKPEIEPATTSGNTVQIGNKVHKVIAIDSKTGTPIIDTTQEVLSDKENISRLRSSIPQREAVKQIEPIQKPSTETIKPSGNVQAYEQTGKSKVKVVSKKQKQITKKGTNESKSSSEKAVNEKEIESSKSKESLLVEEKQKPVQEKVEQVTATKEKVTKTKTEPKKTTEKTKSEVSKIESEDIGVSKVAKRIKASEISIGMEEELQNIPELASYGKFTVKDQNEKIADIINTDLKSAIDMVKGNKPIPNGIIHSLFINGMVNYARKVRDVKLLRDIASSELVSETSRYAQEMRGMAELAKDNPLNIIKKLEEFRKSKVDKIKEKMSELDKSIQKEMNEVIENQKRFEDFLNRIKC